MLIKICGLQKPEDAAVASEIGADLLGVVFAPSKRKQAPMDARNIFAAARPHAERVGIFVNATHKTVCEVIELCQLDRVQFGGNEPAHFCEQFGPRTIKTLRLPNDRDKFCDYRVPVFHLDTAHDTSAGGTGQPWDYSLALEVTKKHRVILGGGLNPTNVAEAIAVARPYGVDVSSGVETGGEKDASKIEAFISAVRTASSEHRSTACR